MLPRQQVYFGTSFRNHLIAVLVHVVGLDDQFRTVLRQKPEQRLKLCYIVCPCHRHKRTVQQYMGNVRFQYPLRDIDGPGKGIPYKVHRAPGCDAHIFCGRGQPDIFRPGLLRRVILILKGNIQEDLHPPDQPVNADGRYQDARRAAAKLCSPVSALMEIEPWNSLHLTSLLHQPLRQGAAQKIGRGALKSQAVDLFIRKPPLL